jgi:hypothetical protein
MISRREFLEMTAKLSGAAVLTGCAQPSRTHDGIVVNGVHSGLNATRVRDVHRSTSAEMLRAAIRTARDNGYRITIAGGRHATGGQQFADGGTFVDMNAIFSAMTAKTPLIRPIHDAEVRHFITEALRVG